MKKFPALGGWNYRLIKDKGYLFIGEVFYNKKGKPIGWCSEEHIGAESILELKRALKLMSLAFNKPVLYVKGGKLTLTART